MKIGIISDTHDQRQRTQKAVEMLHNAGAEFLFHCGDLTEPDIVFDCSTLPCYYVFGNNDDYNISAIRNAITDVGNASCLQWSGEIKLANKRIAMTHGHLQDTRRLLATGPDYLFSGHSHIADDRRVGVTRRINPGALHRAQTYSVALLDLENDSLKFLEIPK